MKSKYDKNRVLVKLQNNKKFDVFDELLKIVIVRGLIAIGILLAFSLLLTFLSVAAYASQVQNTMSVTDYLYSQNHTILKFILFLAAGISVLIIIGVFLASLALFISRKAWKSLLLLCLSVGLFITLFLVPVSHTKTMYAAKVSIKQEYIKKHHNRMFLLTARTEFYSSFEEAKEEVEHYYYDIPSEALVLEQITKKQEVSHPIVHIQLPKNPHNNKDFIDGEREFKIN